MSHRVLWADSDRSRVIVDAPFVLTLRRIRIVAVAIGQGILRVQTDGFVVVIDGALIFTQIVESQTPVAVNGGVPGV